jgi:hypothetical protein
MRRTLLSLVATALAVAVVAAPAVAGGKGRSAKPAGGCKPVVSYIFEGTVASVGSGSFSMDVTSMNAHAVAFGSPVTISVIERTKVVREGARAAATDLVAGDSVNVQVRGCKGLDPATATLAAVRVSATSAVVEPTL